MFRGLLLDLEGVLYEGAVPVTGAAEAVAAVRKRGLALRYLTNTTTQPRRAIAERLKTLGFAVDPGQVFSPPAAALLLLKAMAAKRIHLAADPSLAADFDNLELVDETTPADAIVLGDLYRDFTWDRLNGIFRQIAAGVPLIALHKNRVCKREEGISLDLGPFVAALEYAGGIEAKVVGKPAAAFFGLALDSLGLTPGEVLMIGDDIEADIGGAQGAGIAAVQVRTGKYRPQDDEHPSVRPSGRIDSLASLPDWLGSFGE